METLTLQAQPRDILGKQVKKLRMHSKLPIILYGKGIDSRPLIVDLNEFTKIFKQAGSSTLVNLQVEGQKSPVKVLIHEPQHHATNDKIIHADLYQVNMTQKIRTEIPLEFVGEAPAVTDLEGNLITNRDNIEVECLPDALVPSIEVDISVLKTFDDNIHVSDIKIPEGIEVLTDKEEVVALVTEPRSEEELEEELAETTAEEEKAAVSELEEQAATPEEGSEEQKTEE